MAIKFKMWRVCEYGGLGHSSIDNKTVPGVETSSPPKFGVDRMSNGPQNDPLPGCDPSQLTTTSTPCTVA